MPKFCTISIVIPDDASPALQAFAGRTLTAKPVVTDNDTIRYGLDPNQGDVGGMSLNTRFPASLAYIPANPKGGKKAGESPADIEARAIATLREEGLWHDGHSAARVQNAGMPFAAFRAACRDASTPIAQFAEQARQMFEAMKTTKPSA